MAEINKDELKDMVRQIIAEILKENRGPQPGPPTPSWKELDPSGIMGVRLSQVKPEPFDTGKQDDKVFLKDISSLPESPRLGFGVMEMDQSTFKWTLNYDEVDYVIEGVLDILINGRKISAKAGEVIFIPAKSTIEFSAAGFVRFFYVVYPANWYEQ
ncbi:MAG: ethanolamine utilization protein [Deltaproteobacteria bacterium]|jgi:ethanolamine utilization protein EutQ|nr:ethanolamine utilization protein [Deltaproteobacteria bacterium]